MGLKWEIYFAINILLVLSFIKVMAQPSINQKCGFDRTENFNGLIHSKVEQPQINSPFLNRSSLTIPVVFHIVLTDILARISDETILRQLDFLNQDFQGQNQDRSKVPENFKNRIGQSSIRFCLATEDPSGTPAIGILRVQTPVNQIGIKDDLYSTAKGGSEAWNTHRYLNIWIADTGEAIAGLGSAPGQRNKDEDGVVIHPKLFNQQNPCRTLTHEIGHYLGLFHMWNSDGSCADKDFVEDTPVQAYPYYDCPQEERMTCGSSDMYMNFMDYTDPDCMFFFTRGQTSRMEQILLQFRSSILHTKTECSPQEKISDYLVYPNPISSGSINLRFQDDEPVYLYIQLFGMDGKLIYSRNHWKKKEIKLDLHTLRPSIYILFINGVVKKIVKL